MSSCILRLDLSIRLNEKIPHTQLLSELAGLDCLCAIEGSNPGRKTICICLTVCCQRYPHSVFVRLACAFICGGIIGIERSLASSGGFRTHILICIGAAPTTLTSRYLYLNMHYFTDMARLGAQVVSSASDFINAGTIIVTKRRM